MAARTQPVVNTNTSLRLPVEVLAAVDVKAGDAGVSRSEWLRAAVVAAVDNLSPAKDSGRGSGVDTRRPPQNTPRGGIQAGQGPVRNDAGDARGASSADLGERAHPIPAARPLPSPSAGFDTTPFERGNGCRHPRWRRLAKVCLKCGGVVG